VESLSAYARQFLDQMERPEVDVIEGLSPSIAIEQKPPRVRLGRQSEPSRKFTITCAWCIAPWACRTAELREADYAAIERTDCAGDPARGALQDRRPHYDPGADCARQEGCLPEGLEKLAQDGFVRVRINGGCCRWTKHRC